MNIIVKDDDGKETVIECHNVRVRSNDHDLLIYESDDNSIAINEYGHKKHILVRPRADNAILLA